VSDKHSVDNALESGFYQVDRHIYGLKLGETTLLLARNNEGKTTFVSQIAAHNIKQRVPVYIYSGELSKQKLQSWLYIQIIGSEREFIETVKTKFGKLKQPERNAVYAIKQWHEGLLHIFNNNEHFGKKKSMDTLFDDMQKSAKNNGTKLFIIDNMMTALEANAYSQNADQSNFMQRVHEFGVKNNCHMIVLVHPTKQSEELDITSEKGTLKKTSISGNNDIPNKADNIWALERIFKPQSSSLDDLGDDIPDAYLTSLKDRWEGQRRMFKYFFSKKSKRFYNDTTKEIVDYGWKEHLDDILDNQARKIKSR
jgi:twinkle protein